LGSLDGHTTFDAEAIGVSMALHQLQQTTNPGPTTICLDNQAVLSALRRRVLTTGQSIFREIDSQIKELFQKHWRAEGGFSLRFPWITGHSGVLWNERADAEAKEAS
ncbi:hypothetical protein BDV98DRAFT_485433, partial [Pterulicium gracile]